MSISTLEQNISNLNKEVGSLKGKCELITKQIQENKDLLGNNKVEKEKYFKAIEIVNFVQQQTTDKIKETFEEIVTYALQYIYSSDYKFGLEFDRRGNLGTMNFNIQTPEFKDIADPNDTSGGGVIDIVALALRMVLLEVSQPRVEGPIILDESLKHLSKDFLDNASKFLNEINKKLKRQIIFITHQQQFIDQAEYSVEVK